MPRSPGPGSAPTRMSRPAIGKKSPGEPSAVERNPSKQFRDCFLKSQHSATIYPEQFQEQRIVDRARAAAVVVEAADGGGRRRGGHLGLVLQQSSSAFVNATRWLAGPRTPLGSRFMAHIVRWAAT